MAYVITRLCIDCLDTGCVNICPVDCIYEYAGNDHQQFPNQLYIDPEECIDCGACEPECPWGAIFQEGSVPPGFADDIGLNSGLRHSHEEFRVAKYEPKAAPEPDQVAENKRKWGTSEDLTSTRMARGYQHEPSKRN